MSDLTIHAPKSPPSHGSVVAALGNHIVGGRVRPGETLSGELDLAKRFGVSRSVIRESLRVLGAKGLIRPRRKLGTVVRDMRDWNLLDGDVLAWASDHNRIGELLDSLAEARLAIEPAAAALAAERAGARDLVAIEDALAAMADSSPDHADAHAEADFAFHAAVIGASGNPIFAQFLGLVRAALLESFRRTLPSSEAHARSLLMHQTVFDAIRARDAAAARSATIALLDDARRLLSAASGGAA